MAKFLTLLIFSLISSAALAQVAAAPLQRCTIEGDLRGDTGFFMQYGRDSWTGEVNVKCAVPTYNSQRAMTVTFNSSMPGFGVSAGDVAHLSITMVTTIPLNELRVFQSVSAKTDSVAVVWALETASMQGTVTVLTPEGPMAQSFQRGTLLIR